MTRTTIVYSIIKNLRTMLNNGVSERIQIELHTDLIQMNAVRSKESVLLLNVAREHIPVSRSQNQLPTQPINSLTFVINCFNIVIP